MNKGNEDTLTTAIGLILWVAGPFVWVPLYACSFAWVDETFGLVGWTFEQWIGAWFLLCLVIMPSTLSLEKARVQLASDIVDAVSADKKLEHPALMTPWAMVIGESASRIVVFAMFLGAAWLWSWFLGVGGT